MRRFGLGRRVCVLSLAAVLMAAAAACGSSGNAPENASAKPQGRATVAPGLTVRTYPSLKGTVTLAHSPGLLFGSFLVLQQAHVLEKMWPNMNVVWKTINETSQQRDALLAGDLDFTSCSSWPFIQGWASGVPWKVVAVPNDWDGELFVKPGSMTSIKDFLGTSEKLSPGPGTTQQLVTSVYLAHHGQGANALAKNWTLLPHTDAIQAVKSGQLAGEFATGEYVTSAEEAGLKPIFRLSDANDGKPFASSCAAVADSYLDKNPAVVRLYAQALNQVSAWIVGHHADAAKLMAETTGGQASPALFEKALKDPRMTDFSDHQGLLRETAQSLKQLGLISKIPTRPSQVYAFPNSVQGNW